MENNNFKVLLAPTAEMAKELAQATEIVASVEAEYGEICIEGTEITLAHHGSRSANPAPCNNCNAKQLENGGTILVSHIDLDTIGGVLALMGLKPEDPTFWRGAEYMDVYGTHHIHELNEKVQDKLNAVYAWNSTKQRARVTEVTDVTESILEWLEILEPVLGSNPDQEWLDKGKRWAEEIVEAVESKLISETENIRIFITDSVFCSSSYYSPKFNKYCKSTIVLNTELRSIVIAFFDGGKEASAREIVQELWGEDAGGHAGIAGSPRGWSIPDNELRKEFHKAIAKVEQALQ